MTFGDEKMRIDQTKPKIKSQILSNLFNEKYGLRLGEFKNTTGTERVNRTKAKQPGKQLRLRSKLYLPTQSHTQEQIVATHVHVGM